MKANEQTLQEVERAIRKIADKFPPTDEASMLTDIHLRVNQETGELVVHWRSRRSERLALTTQAILS